MQYCWRRFLPDSEIRLYPDSRIGYPSIRNKELRNKSRPGKSADLEGRRKWKMVWRIVKIVKQILMWMPRGRGEKW